MSFERFKNFEGVVTLCCIGMLAYFGLHAYAGSRGYGHRDQLMAQLDAISKQAAEIETQRVSLETRVVHMRPDNIDPDLLDELARRELFLGHKNEIIVKTSQ
jgi:cell division protein FtsB